MKKIFFVLIIVSVFFGLYKLTSLKPSVNGASTSVAVDNPDVLIYWGEGCPHCENVKKFIQDNQLNTKFKISLKEIYSNVENRNALKETINNNCPEYKNSDSIGVPFSYIVSEKKCFMGDKPIIDWFKTKSASL